MYNWCTVQEYNIEKFNLPKFIDENKQTSDGTWWNIYEKREDFIRIYIRDEKRIRDNV